jgi:rod shape-determining protein MreD
MSWSIFFAALVGVYVVQMSIVRIVGLHVLGHEPVDLFLVLMLIYGLLAPRDDARLAGVLCGLGADLGGSGPLGIHMLCLGLGAWLLTNWRDALRTHVWSVRAVVGFLPALLAEVAGAIHERYWTATSMGLGSLLFGGLLTALVATVLAATITGLPGMPRSRSRPRAAAWR